MICQHCQLCIIDNEPIVDQFDLYNYCSWFCAEQHQLQLERLHEELSK
jgi:hypothetical protein